MSSASVPQTDDQFNSLPPVRTVSGAVLWRVRVTPGERTCLVCGDTFAAGDVCTRCSQDRHGNNQHKNQPRSPSVATLDYLQPNEYEVGGIS